MEDIQCSKHSRSETYFSATSLSTNDFSTLYTTLPHNRIKEKLLDLIEWTFKRALKNYGSLHLACNDRKAFFTSSDQSQYTLWSCQNVCDALSYLLDNIYIRFGTKLYRQIVGIPMGTDCAPLVADLFLYCYERDFMDSLSPDNQADVIEKKSRQRSGKGAIRKRFPLQKPRWEKTKLTIRYLYHENIS